MPASGRWLLLALVVMGFLLRVFDLGETSLSHPEAFTPNLPFPADISWPLPRLGFFRTIHWHLYEEPHPVAYYTAMYVWAKVFGTSTFAIRLPSALLGAAAIPVIFMLADRTLGRRTAWIASVMLTLHGFHIYWSGQARMYVPALFFSALATLALVEIRRRPKPGLPLYIGYVAALTAALHSTELSWGIWGMHYGWTVLTGDNRPVDVRGMFSAKRWRVSPVAALQSIAFTLGVPELAHSLYHSRYVHGLDTKFLFLRQYVSFGFLVEGDGFALPMRILPTPVEVAIFVFASALLLLGLRQRPRWPARTEEQAGFPAMLLYASAALGTVTMLGFIALTDARVTFLVLATFPLGSLALPVLATLFRPTLAKYVPAADALLENTRLLSTPFPLLGVGAPLLLFAASAVVTILASRAFAVFIPFILILTAAGLASIKPRWAFATIGAGVAAIFLWLCVHGIQRPNSPRDYRGLAERMHEASQPGDMVFVRYRNWADTPLIYYFPNFPIAGKDYDEVLRANPSARIWVPYWPRIKDPSPKIDAALEGYVPIAKVTARRGYALLYAKNTGQTPIEP